MMRRVLFAVLPVLFCTPALQAQDKPPAIAGYVTAITSPTEFDVNGTHIRCTATTQLQQARQADASDDEFITQTTQDRYLGQAIDVYGKANKKTYTIVATRIVMYPAPTGELSGNAIIDKIPDTSAPAQGERLVRADGYLILITPKTQTTFTPPLKSLTDVETNVWIKYTGKQRADGILVADTAVFTKNIVVHSEDNLRTKSEYDPESVAPSSKQSAVSKYFLGINPKKIPPYNNPDMQVRVDRIGRSLIPAYQHNLPDTDPSKINFRFQLIDQSKWHDAMTLPNGIILVPRQVVERVQNDSQLATVLADNIACALEKQSFIQIPSKRKMTGAQLAADAGGVFVPFLGDAVGFANYKISQEILRHAQEQSGRISLFLLHDAGYDIHQAPLAWWLLAPKYPTPMIDTPLPERSAYLYQALGTTWRNLPATTDSSQKLLK